MPGFFGQRRAIRAAGRILVRRPTSFVSMTGIVYTRRSLIQMVLGPTIAPYGTAKPSFLYSFALRPDNLARYPNR